MYAAADGHDHRHKRWLGELLAKEVPVGRVKTILTSGLYCRGRGAPVAESDAEGGECAKDDHRLDLQILEGDHADDHRQQPGKHDAGPQPSFLGVKHGESYKGKVLCRQQDADGTW